jgi:Fibronectin type III domain
MKFHAFSPRAATIAAGMAILLVGGAATGASAAVTSTPAPSAPASPQVITTTTAPPQQDTPTPPGAPTGLTATPGNGTVTLSWSAPSSDGGSPVDGYVIQGGTSPSGVSITDQITGTTATMSGLTNGTTYFFRVNAHNPSGDGAAATVTVTPNGMPATPVTPAPHTAPAQAGPASPTGLTAQPRRGEIVLSWSPPPGGLKAGEGYLIYMATSPGHEGAKPSVPHLIEFTTSYTVAPLNDGTRYYFQVALLDGTQVSPRSAEVSAVPGVGAGAAPGPTPGVGAPAKSDVDKAGQPTAAPLPATEAAKHRASSSPPAGLIVLLAGLSLAATGGAIAIVLVQRRRRRHGQGYGYAPVPAPRRPHDDQPVRPSSRVEELNGPRYR